MTKRIHKVAMLSGVTLLLFVSAVRAQEAVDELVVTQVEFITTPISVPDDVDQLWKYLESATLDGPSVELLALNGLRVGKLNVRFRKEFDAVLKKVAVTRRLPQTVQMLPGRPQEFSIGPTVTDRTLFVWKSPTSFLGRRYSRARYGLTLAAKPASTPRCRMSIRPILRHGESLNERLDLDFLTVQTSMETGESMVLSPTPGKPAGLGALFFWSAEGRDQLRTFVIVTLTAVRNVETD